jgi:hypothetical protein
MKLNFFLISFLFCSGFAYASKEPVARIPFELQNSRIVVSMKINDSPKTLRMLFDTGADGVGLKKSVADDIGVKENRIQTTQVVGASMQVGISEKNTLVFDSLKIPNQNIAIFPDHNDDLDGLFGSAFLRYYNTCIDFENSVIELYSFGEKNYPDGYESIPLIYTGLPVVSANIQLNSGKELAARLFFDTGANYSLILFGGSVVKNDLEEGFRVQSRGTTVSMGRSTPTVSGIFDFVELGKSKLENFTGTLQTTTSNGQAFREEADGSLGIEIIRKFNWYIDLSNKEFHLKANKYFHDPLPFWLGGAFFSVTGDKIRVIGIKPSETGIPFPVQTGDIIESMNDETPVTYIQSKTGKELVTIMNSTGIELVVSRNDLQFLVTLPLK